MNNDEWSARREKHSQSPDQSVGSGGSATSATYTSDGFLRSTTGSSANGSLGSRSNGPVGGSGNGSSSDDTQDQFTRGLRESPSLDPSNSGEAPLESLQRDGPILSAGSTGHPEGCLPCSFYCFSYRGCRNGTDCSYCHLAHESKLRQRREDWKKAQKKHRVVKRREERSLGTVAVTVNGSPKVPENGAQLVRELASELPAYQTRGVAGAASPGVTAGLNDLPMYLEFPVNMGQVETTIPAPIMPMVPELATVALPREGILYYPSAVHLKVGEPVELWPPVSFLDGYVFAVHPVLPRGLSLSEEVGMIYGTPTEATDGTLSFFVTAAKLGAVRNVGVLNHVDTGVISTTLNIKVVPQCIRQQIEFSSEHRLKTSSAYNIRSSEDHPAHGG